MNYKQKYNNSVKGVITNIYASQKGNCKRRCLELPKYSKKEFSDWILSQPNFQEIYKNWVDSGYDKKLKPSIDRIDDYKGYSIDNIQLMTWSENHYKGNFDRVNGINNKTNVSVSKYDLEGNFLCDFHSIKEASRKTNIVYSNILECCQGKRKTAGGFKWKYYGRNTLFNGCCLKLMNRIPDKSIDLILCDLPYGTTNCKWDSVIDLNKIWIEYKRIIKDNGAILLFAQTPFDKVLGCSNLQMLRYEWIWEKTQATGHLNAKKMPLKAHENILVFYKKLPTYNAQKTYGHKPVNSYTKRIKDNGTADGEIYGKTKKVSGGGSTSRYPRSVVKYPSDKQKTSLHPTQKPISLLEFFIKTYSNVNDLVLDNTMGSGSTGVASLQLNRRFIGIELDEKFYNISKKRMSNIEPYLI